MLSSSLGIFYDLSRSTTATVFLELWKRQRAQVVLHWDLYGWDEDQVRKREERNPLVLRIRRISHDK